MVEQKNQLLRLEYDLQSIVNEIDDGTDGIGSDISMSFEYDEIKNARMHDDPRLSFGVWERELKKADWVLVESLSVEILMHKSKDLQVVAWLIESLVAMDGFSGAIKSFEILRIFLESFWYTCFPKNDDGSSDEEQKIRIISWIIDNINTKLLTRHIISDISLYDYEYALEMRSLIKRSPSSEVEILKSAKDDGKKTADDIQIVLKKASQVDVEKIVNDIVGIRKAIYYLSETIEKISKKEPIVSFSGILSNLDKIEKIINISGQQNKESSQKMQDVEINNVELPERDAIYMQISKLSGDLKKLDRHSPVPFVLDLIVTWKDKSLFNIMDDLQAGGTEAHKLLKILVNR